MFAVTVWGEYDNNSAHYGCDTKGHIFGSLMPGDKVELDGSSVRVSRVYKDELYEICIPMDNLYQAQCYARYLCDVLNAIDDLTDDLDWIRAENAFGGKAYVASVAGVTCEVECVNRRWFFKLNGRYVPGNQDGHNLLRTAKEVALYALETTGGCPLRLTTGSVGLSSWTHSTMSTDGGFKQIHFVKSGTDAQYEDELRIAATEEIIREIESRSEAVEVDYTREMRVRNETSHDEEVVEFSPVIGPRWSSLAGVECDILCLTTEYFSGDYSIAAVRKTVFGQLQALLMPVRFLLNDAFRHALIVQAPTSPYEPIVHSSSGGRVYLNQNDVNRIHSLLGVLSDDMSDDIPF